MVVAGLSNQPLDRLVIIQFLKALSVKRTKHG
jgi:hypothetical protein